MEIAFLSKVKHWQGQKNISCKDNETCSSDSGSNFKSPEDFLVLEKKKYQKFIVFINNTSAK